MWEVRFLKVYCVGVIQIEMSEVQNQCSFELKTMVIKIKHDLI